MPKNRYNFEEIYTLKDGQSQKYYRLGEFLLPAIIVDTVVKQSDLNYEQLFTDKSEVNYQCMLYKVRNGKKFITYRRSKYYNYYKERLRDEHPEFLI